MQIKTSTGQVIDLTPQQLSTYDPGLYSRYLQSLAQPQASLGQTQASTANTIASGQLTQANVNQLNLLKQSGSIFEKNAGKDGFVSPQIYNQQKAAYVGAGGLGADFDKTYEDNYVSPNNIFYDTPDAKQARGVLPLIKNVVDSYRNLNKLTTGPEAEALTNIPFLGPWIQQRFLQANTAHNQFLMGQAGNIRQIAGAGQGQGFRFNLQELNNIIGLLPEGYDTQGVASKKLHQLNSYMNQNMGVNLQNVLSGDYTEQ